MVLVVSALTLAGCTGDSPKGGSTPTHRPTPAAQPKASVGEKIKVAGLVANYHGTKNVAGAKSVYVEIEDNYFAPTVIKAKPSQKILLRVENESQSPHTLTIGGRYVNQQIQPGMISEVRVTMPKSGNLSFFCTFEKKAGMAGGFNVSGPIGKPGPKKKTADH
jgi:plastocyanin